ncbi:thiamine phosphate synthase [Prolixibacteraceae bacterium JC049]|nr:thiamine phosphate synthase [Prolixibacteraceae bacterium JC049]
MIKEIPRIHYITQDHPTLSHAEQAKLVLEAGYSCVQIRMKDHSDNAIKKEIVRAQGYAEKYNGTLVLNDYPHLAKEMAVRAIHLGLNDMPIKNARELLGADVIIGGTANCFEDIVMHYENGADYIGLGPYRFTTTKKNLSPIIGIEGYNAICQQLKDTEIDIPVLAVGGIRLEELELIQNTGMWGIALSGDLLNQIEKSN